MTRNEETKIVKAALKEAGLSVVSVKHHRGTAWGWLSIYLQDGGNHAANHHDLYPCECPGCQQNREREQKAIEVIQAVTGRHGDYNGKVNISTRRAE